MERDFSNPVNLLRDIKSELLNKTALIQPERKCFSNKIRYNRLNYSDLRCFVGSYTKTLKKRGIKKGDRILVVIPFSFELYIAIISILGLGATAVFVEPWMMKKEYCHLMDKSKTRAIITNKKIYFFLRIIGFIKTTRNYISPPKLSNCVVKETIININEIDSNIPAVITFSTGSKDVPKMITRTYGDLNCQMNQLSQVIPDTNYTDLITFPNLILYNISRKGTTVIPYKKYKGGDNIDDEIFRNSICDLYVKRIFTSPSNIKEIFKKKLNYKIDTIYTGGSFIQKTCLEKLENVGSVKIFYGSTEIEPISLIDRNSYINECCCRGIPVGKSIKNIEIKIIRYENYIGEVLVRYRNYKHLSHSEKWFYTGDIGYIDKNGTICLMGRKSSIIKYGGRYIYPYELLKTFENNKIYNTIAPILKKNKLYIVVEKDSNINNIELEKNIEKELIKLNIKNARIVFVDKIPMDPRHRSKIDIKKLKEII
ncbi:AMP-binding protein [candidate division WOR-3 bacterium]|nr:AMP-binding protein [candidate division WOR-3 bacterium]